MRSRGGPPLAELTNDFAWSKSRDEAFQACPRQYYFKYYGFWGGWEYSAPERTRQLYVLSKLQSRPMWAGATVHSCIERTLKNLRRGIDVLNPEKIIEVTISQMRDGFKSSREGTYWDKPKTCALFEHEYGLPVPDAAWRQTAEDVKACLHSFYTSDLFARLRALARDAWLEVEEFSSFTLDGVKVWAVIDCSFRDGALVDIYDWKTGRSVREQSTIQLKCYAIYAHETWGVLIENVRVAEYYLMADSVRDYRVTASDVEDTRAYIRGSVADMRSLLADVTHNEPLAESAFEKTDDRKTCRRCNFVGVCRRELVAEMRSGGRDGLDDSEGE